MSIFKNLNLILTRGVPSSFSGLFLRLLAFTRIQFLKNTSEFHITLNEFAPRNICFTPDKGFLPSVISDNQGLFETCL